MIDTQILGGLTSTRMAKSRDWEEAKRGEEGARTAQNWCAPVALNRIHRKSVINFDAIRWFPRKSLKVPLYGFARRFASTIYIRCMCARVRSCLLKWNANNIISLRSHMPSREYYTNTNPFILLVTSLAHTPAHITACFPPVLARQTCSRTKCLGTACKCVY